MGALPADREHVAFGSLSLSGATSLGGAAATACSQPSIEMLLVEERQLGHLSGGEGRE